MLFQLSSTDVKREARGWVKKGRGEGREEERNYQKKNRKN